ncbi:MAG: hypothetical protein U0R19_07995, partial [Bryobacteraceae bacterium]
MLNIFRRHVQACPDHRKRTRNGKCRRKPPCPVHYEGIDGQGRRIKPKALIDPRTGNGVRDWARANEVLRDLEAPTPIMVPENRTTIAVATDHFLNLKKSKSSDTYRKNRTVLTKFSAFMSANPRNHEFMTDVRFADLTDFCTGWTGAERSRIRDLGILTSFLKYCY